MEFLFDILLVLLMLLMMMLMACCVALSFSAISLFVWEFLREFCVRIIYCMPKLFAAIFPTPSGPYAYLISFNFYPNDENSNILHVQIKCCVDEIKKKCRNKSTPCKIAQRNQFEQLVAYVRALYIFIHTQAKKNSNYNKIIQWQKF